MDAPSQTIPPEVSSRRSLIWVPIVHTKEDMGSLGDSVARLSMRRLGKAKWDAHLRNVDAQWKEIRRIIDDRGLDYPRVRLYQDGLPICDHEEKIVRELALAGSANHLLLVDLIERGARLSGTESPQLLLKEYELNRYLLSDEGSSFSPSSLGAMAIQREARRLLEARDQFIASRIVETLQPAEQGLIFLGKLHSLEGRLPGDILLTILRPGQRSAPPKRPARRHESGP
jgi:hypothetical protein